jgi:hypothetical protein
MAVNALNDPAMLYAKRNAEGAIESLSCAAVAGGEALPADHPDVLAFLREAGGEQEAFSTLDASLVRVLEDLVDVLIHRNVIRITDLPPEAQQKLFERKRFRESTRGNALKLVPDADDQ